MERDWEPEVVFDNRTDPLTLPEGAPFPIFGSDDAIPCGSGAIAFRGRCASLFASIDKDVQKFAGLLGAGEVVLPGSLSITDLKKCGYLAQFPQFATLLATLDVQSAPVSDLAAALALGKLRGLLEEPHRACSSAICLPIYPCFEGRRLEATESVALTARGRVFRRETLDPSKPERLNEFSVRDIIFFGSAAFVEQQLRKCEDWLRQLVRACRLRGVIQSADDSFFCPDAEALRAYQHGSRSKFELLLLKPDSSEMVAVASVNHHGSHFSKAFDIRFRGGDFIHTGCFGVGLERVLLLIGSHYGFDESHWPESLRTRLGKETGA